MNLNNRKKMGILLIVIGVILTGAGVAVLLGGAKESSDETVVDLSKSSAPEIKSDNINISEKENTAESAASDEVGQEDDSYEKGLAFEKFVIKKFDKRYWELDNWTPDKEAEEGRYVKSSQNPDVQLTLKAHGKTYPIAVECKWRKRVSKEGTVKWSYPAQIERYREYEQNTRIPTFVAIGIGGEPTQPHKLYMIPLSALKNPVVKIDDLDAYRLPVKKNFFYNPETGKFEQ